MCNSKDKSNRGALGLASVAQIDGRPVLQPASNRVATADAGRPLKKKSLQKSLSLPSTFGNTNGATTASGLQLDADYDAGHINFRELLPPASPKPVNNDSNNEPAIPNLAAKLGIPVARNKSKKLSENSQLMLHVETTSLFSRDRARGSVAAEQREQACLAHAQRRMRIARYGRTASNLEGKVVPVLDSSNSINDTATINPEQKRCSFITPNSDPLYVAYHDEEWGVPVHDDRMLFELLVLTGAQVGSDWTTILRKRNEFRAAFGGFDAEAVGRFTERQMASISEEHVLDLGRVRGIVDNANRILQVQRDFGSLDRYLWGFVNHKPQNPGYKFSRKIPVKTSKSESISKDLIRRGFRFVGPTVVHSFMQAAGLTNDHLVSCPRHLQCSSSASSAATAAAAAAAS